ncbi:MAG TPA: CHAT domain-containing tetratricopeptide repeat protein [Candidatus Krumholzibacteria bacterium]|nr:CHAT domain-containing tetratricopeptide repeat protein [Candidatus Krumholzibacteria bacterium]
MSRLVTLIVLVSALAVSAAFPPRSSRHPGPADRTADSLFDAGAYDTMLAFVGRELTRARARGDSLGVGRMTYERGRARQILRVPGGLADLNRAHAIAVTENDSLGWINALGVKSFFAMVDGRLDESLRMNAERIPIAKAIGNTRNEAWGHLLVGYVSLLRENLPTARSEYEIAATLFRKANRPAQELTALIGLARVLERQGDGAGTKSTYQRALVIAQELGDKSQESDVWNNLATMEYEHGDLAVSERYFRRAYLLKRSVDAPDIDAAAANVADISVLLGSYSAAESVLVDALARSRKWGYTSGVHTLLCELGNVRMAQGRHTGAVSCYRRALSSHGSIENRVEAATGLAAALTAQGDVDAANAALDSHLVDLGRVTPSAWRAAAYVMWARTLRAGGNVPRAGRTARAAWDDAASRSDTTGAVVAATELGMCLREAGEVETAYAWFQRARAMFIARSLRASEFHLREAQRVSLAEPLLELSPVLLDWPREVKRGERERRLFDFIQEIKARTLLERVADPRRARDIDPSFSIPATATEIQTTVLRPGECLVDFTFAGRNLLAFAVTTEALLMVRIDNADDIQKHVSRYHRLLAQRPAESSEPGDVHAAARSLGMALFGDVAQLVGPSTRVYVATDGWLAALPVETLVCPSDPDVPMLVARDVVRVPSATMLRLQRGRIARPYATGNYASVLAVASQASELQGARREINRLASRYQNVERLRASDRDAFIEAIGRHDVVHVASHVRVDAERPWHSGILITDAGPSGAGGERAAGGQETPAPGGVAEASTIDPTRALPVDPYARAAQIAEAQSDARLVVLSGCESALGRATQGEGVLGVAAAFFAAGARSLVASIWEVDDAVTADLMERFYAQLSEGKSVAAALRAAQLDVREDRPHPFYWAGFVVIGDGDVSVRLGEQPAGKRYLFIALIAAVLGVVAWVIVRGRGTIQT